MDADISNNNWEVLKRFLPNGWEEQAKTLGALTRQRKASSPEKLLRLLMIHLADGCSLRETAARAKAGDLADISDVALLKRLRSASEWFRWMAQSLLERRGVPTRKPEWLSAYCVRSVDASVISEPGSTGTDWRLHYSQRLFGLQCDEFKITRPEVGESLTNYDVSRNDLVVGDRGYCSLRSMNHARAEGGHFLIRYRHKAFKLSTASKPTFPLLSLLASLRIGEVGDWLLLAGGEQYEALEIRLCAIKKSEEAAELAVKRALRQASKKQKSIPPETLELQRYVILLTSVDKQAISATQIMELYRCRWQIEIAFKRLKSIMGLGHLPKKDLESARAWLHGKLLVALLVRAIVDEGRFFSPWGYPIEQTTAR